MCCKLIQVTSPVCKMGISSLNCLIDLFIDGLMIEHRLSVTVYPPWDYSGVPIGTRSGIVRAPAGLRPGHLQAESVPHRLSPGCRRGSGRVLLLPFNMLSPCPVSRRAPTGQVTGLIRGLFLAGAQVTFELKLKVTRGPGGVKNPIETA